MNAVDVEGILALAAANRVGLVLPLIAAVSCGDLSKVEQAGGSGPDPARPCLRDDAAIVLDPDYVITDQADIAKQELLSAKYQTMPGIRAVVTSATGERYLVVDEEVDGTVTREAQADGLKLVRSCVSSSDLRSAQAMKLDLSKDNYMAVSYNVLRDEIEVSTSVPLDQVVAAIDRAGISSTVAIAGADPGIDRGDGWGSD